MPCATSPSAMPLTSSSCSPQNSAIWRKVSVVFSTSQTAVAFCMSGSVICLIPVAYNGVPRAENSGAPAGAKIGFRGGVWMRI